MILSLLFYLSTNTGKDLGRKFYESSDTNPAVFASLCIIVVPVLIFIIMKKFLRKRTRNTTRPPRVAEPQLGEQITTGKLLLCILSEFCDVTNCSLTVQSVENCRKECHRSWLRLRHTVIPISNDRTSASKKIHRMALIRTLTLSTTVFERKKEELYGFRQTE